ncbi:heterokaryon incompatibility protein-domain-containing protein [Triangularia setosa]|uniref:Heterokaryon incompatibility protein-domain-containing protein n=1 Tax=Triangularia setosa TaxID=2587417 RepID=A0AAN6W1X9_9PEZI|nr:heterokaryon incompatibility protein-domain-containing protein [Podospora setosa]
MAVPKYQYRQLDLSRDAIRLVRLCRGCDKPLRCELFESFLHECDGVPYSALSYTWGGTAKQHEILINDCTSFITENLYRALWDLREQHVDRVLWIDAICIDQDNHKERGHQVAQMRSIYGNAEEVVVWLGTRSPVTDTAMDLLDRVNRYINAVSTGSIWRRSKAVWLSELEQRRKLFLVGLEQEQVEKQREALKVLLQSPWFKRVWIIQEVAHARRSTITCGRRSVPARTLAMAPGFIHYQPERHIQSILDVMPGFHRQESWWTRKRTLGTLLDKFEDSASTDPRDKVFALLGMAIDGQSVILPDYEVPEAVVVQRVASFLVFGKLVDVEFYEFPQWPVDRLFQCVSRLINQTLRSAVVRTSVWREPNGADLGLTEDERLPDGYTPCRLVSMRFWDVSRSGGTSETITKGIADIFGNASNESVVVNAPNLTGHISLGVAISLGNFICLQLLLGYSNLTEAFDGIDGWKSRAVWLATYKRHAKAIRLITYASDMTAEIPSNCAMPGEGKDILDLLLFDSHNLDMETLHLRLSNNDDTPIMIMVYAVEIRALEFLVARGALLETVMALPNTRSWLVNLTEILTVLPQSEASSGMICTRLKAEAASYGSMPRVPRASALTHQAFQACVHYGHVELVKLALMRGIAGSPSYSAEESLASALRNGRTGVVKVLLEHGFDITAQRRFQTPALHEAVIEYNGHNEEMVKLLLQAGADVTLPNPLGQSPLDLAYSQRVAPSVLWPPDAMESLEGIIGMLEKAKTKRDNGLSPIFGHTLS